MKTMFQFWGQSIYEGEANEEGNKSRVKVGLSWGRIIRKFRKCLTCKKYLDFNVIS